MEDVTQLTKEEFLKFLNCSLHSDKPEKVERLTVPGPNNSVITLVKRVGKFRACHVELEENSINNRILRVPLPVVDLKSLSTKEVALRFRKQISVKNKRKNNIVVSRFGRKIKKKQLFIQSISTRARSTRSSTNSFAEQTKNKKLNTKKMDVSTHNSIMPDLKQYENKKLLRSRPQFIIKYVPNEPTYFLTFGKIRKPEDGKLQYSFDTLVKDIKNMKLPSPTWKIKVVVRNNKISSIVFTNKCVLERTVTFNSKSDIFEVILENKPAILLGSPGIVSCIEDIEILLNIIHTISAQNPMVYYKN